MGFHIRNVKKGDAPTLAMIQTTSWKHAFKNILTSELLESYTNIDHVEAMYSRLLNEGIGHGYIGEVGDHAHCIAYWDRARDNDMAKDAEIICIHSLPDNWRRGYGSKMMQRLLSDIAAAGYKQVVLWVFCENERARAFYEANGFRPTEKTKLSFGTTAICYVKAL